MTRSISETCRIAEDKLLNDYLDSVDATEADAEREECEAERRRDEEREEGED